MRHTANLASLLVVTCSVLLCSFSFAATTPPPDCDAAGISPGTLSFCEGSVCLYDYLQGVPDPGGFWTGPAGWASDGTGCGNFDTTVDPLGDYTYSVITDGGEICSAVITVVEAVAPSEENDASFSFCTSIGSINLFEHLNGTVPSGGIWTDPDGYEVFNPYSFYIDPYPWIWGQGGQYVYTVSDGNCVGSTTLMLLPEGQPNAGGDWNYTLCNSQLGEIIFGGYLSQTADGDGYVISPSGNVGESSSTLIYEGDYIYVEPGGNLCPNDTGWYNFTFEGPDLAPYFNSYCNPTDPTTWYLEVDIIGGEPPFISEDGIIINNTFYSYPMSMNQYTVDIGDNSGCVFQYWDFWPLEFEDGECEATNILGCMDPDANNYNPFANIPGVCEATGYEDAPDELSMDEPDSGGAGLVDANSDLNSSWDFSIFPNPWDNTSKLNVVINDATNQAAHIEIIDIAGRVVFNQKWSIVTDWEQLQIPIEEQLHSGMYFTRILVDGQSQSQHLIIQ